MTITPAICATCSSRRKRGPPRSSCWSSSRGRSPRCRVSCGGCWRRCRARPLCAPAPAGPGVHDRRRRPAAAVRPDQDAAAARACLSRGHGGRDAPHPRARRGAGTRRAELSYESPRPGRRLVNDTRPLVLIADDEPQLREVLQRALERGGYRVLGAGSAESAYELLAAERVDAVLLDVHLPTMSGLALYLAILNRWPALAGRIAIMTGDAEAEEVRA